MLVIGKGTLSRISGEQNHSLAWNHQHLLLKPQLFVFVKEPKVELLSCFSHATILFFKFQMLQSETALSF
jgi:hypothetical protein